MTTAPDGTIGPGGRGGYGSHQPALRALAKFMPIRSVIEFGAGPFSTHLFLDPTAFPDLTSLITLESDADWAETVRVKDRRHRIIVAVPGHMAMVSADMRADFVFLDNAPMPTRMGLVHHAILLAPVIGIHDCMPADIIDMPGLNAQYVVGFERPILTVFASNTVDISGIKL